MPIKVPFVTVTSSAYRELIKKACKLVFMVRLFSRFWPIATFVC